MSEFINWEQYRRAVVVPAGFTCVGPGVWAMKDADGNEVATFQPFDYYDGAERWRHYADAGLGPDGEPIEEEHG